MSELPTIEPFDAKFEDLNIHVDSLTVKVIEDDSELKYTALTDIRHIMTKHYYENGRDLIGNLFIVFRNQGKDFNSILLVNSVLMVRSETDNDGASVFCKMVQYMFDWVGNYIKENNIKDLTGEDFIMPEFHYSKIDFPSFQG